jgi:hypothetical protein
VDSVAFQMHLPNRPLIHLRHLFNHSLWLSHFLKPWKEINVTETGKDPKFPQNICLISLLSTTGKLFKRVIQKIVQRYIEERGLLNASQFDFRVCRSTTLQYMSLMTISP